MRNGQFDHQNFRKTEDQLHDEVLSRSHLETKKLELMSEISGLKLRQTEMEHENKELRRKLQAVSVDRSMYNNIGIDGLRVSSKAYNWSDSTKIGP